MAYTTIDDPAEYFNIVTFTGDGTDDRAITVGFQPDLTWMRQRTDASGGYITDAVRGNNAALQTTNGNAEGTFADMTFTSTGITVSSNENLNNEDAHNYVSFHWKESATAGFDIVSYTGDGSNRTISHSLSAVPKVMFVKRRSGDASDWTCFFEVLGNTKRLILNDTSSVGTATTWWNSTTPTSSVFSLGTSGGVNNDTDTYINYLFTDVQGFSKFGKYTGNGNADGAFVHLGFRPAWFLVKRTDSTNNWVILRYNDLTLEVNTTEAEYSGNYSDFTSNGIKMRNTAGFLNASGGTYIYAAFAEQPFVNSNGVPCNAR